MSRADYENLDKTFAITIILVVLAVLIRLYVFTPTPPSADFTQHIPTMSFSSIGGASL